MPAFLRFYIQCVFVAFCNAFAVCEQFPFKADVRKVAEEVFIVNFQFSFAYIYRRNPNVLVYVAYFACLWLGFAVGAYETVVVEVVVGSRVTSEVTSVSENNGAVFVLGA